VNVLIVGGTSALGSALKPVLSEFSHVVTGGRRDGDDVHIDLNGPVEEMCVPEGLDAVIHTAAQFGGTSDADMLATEAVNVLGTLKLCQAAVRAGVKHFVLISSMSACVKETSEYYGIYALSKRQSEDVARLYCTYRSMPLAIVRPSQIYGNQDEFRRHQPFIYAMVDKAEKGENITIYGSHDAIRNYIHVDDVATVIAKVILDKVEGTYASVHPVDRTYSQIADAAFAAFGVTGRVHFLTDKPDIPDNVFEQDDSLYRRIAFYPRISIEEGMKQIALYRRTPRG
jgi:UDP-glucose 4-epimerase